MTAEIPGIFRWALAGRADLEADGRFCDPANGLHEKLCDLAQNLRSFVDECCIVGAGEWVAKSRLYQVYRKWAGENGHEPGASHTFGETCGQTLPEIDASKKTPTGKRERWNAYYGVSLSDEGRRLHAKACNWETPRPELYAYSGSGHAFRTEDEPKVS